MKNYNLRQQGFTLIELLAVIVILAVIALIATPMILGVIDTAKHGAAESSALGFVDAIEKTVILKMMDGEVMKGDYTVAELKNSVSFKGNGPSKGKITISTVGEVSSATLCINNYKISYDGKKAEVVETNCDDMSEVLEKYTESILNGTDPVLGTNMIPVIIADNGDVTYADTNTKWYNYASKVWANAVILIDSPSTTYVIGDTIIENDIESYFVWVPRYKYKLFNTGEYSGYITGKNSTSNAQTIEIVFESKDKTVSNGTLVGNYLTHVTFTTLDVNGMWVGKFETGYAGATSIGTAHVNTIDSSKIIVKPNVYSWRYNTVYNMFMSAYNYDTTNGSHMMKNTEWGAVSYLSSSVYGINKEVNINNNSSYLTGYSAVEGTDQSKFYGTFEASSDITLPYNTTTGYLASTTGNISGIYDMSGGAHEYMASYISGQLGSSGFDTTTIANTDYTKYLDVYNASSTIDSYQYRILGDATGEMGPFYYYKDGDNNYRRHNGWYADGSNFVEASNPWFYRGGSFYYGVLAGQFFFDRITGEGIPYMGSRLVLAIN
ncbi:MAG: type II secretion system protein [Bacilli bacterium]